MKRFFARLGPGFLLAATGVGAGDMFAAAVAGAVYGSTLVWAPFLGALMKGFLSEGIARWQAVTGQTVLRTCVRNFPRPVGYLFVIYLFIWGFMAAAALMAACGLAANALFPAVGLKTWAIVHSLIALLFVWFGNYRFIETVMKVFVALLVLTITVSALRIDVNWTQVAAHLRSPAISADAIVPLLALIGGVGGSVTLLSYSYWMREKGWQSPDKLTSIRTDLFAAYTFVGLFGAAMIVIAADLKPDVIQGSGIILALADQVGQATNLYGKMLFLLGFWGAVFSSMVGVWDGVPYLFDDFLHSIKHRAGPDVANSARQDSRGYRGFLIYLALPPMSLLFLDRPVWIVIAYAVAGSLFMPLLGVFLLDLNNRRIAGAYRYGWLANVVVAACVVLFGVLAITKLRSLM